MWAVLAGSWLACQGPSLFTYSWDDSVADPFRELVVAWLQEAKAAYLMRRAHSQHADALQAALPGSNAKPATASLMSKL
ncbi:hypothetical protein HaLaN_27789 [Haematococcus lacustris]|uniref:Uncharacterized protein n=1 Tax=Haematococcus lacustris TaxID=44745 RepID=A0A6A0A8X1_HAELA|nr:hypothetical protein HaLaN_27789 [Haematococcus lacustris]